MNIKNIDKKLLSGFQSLKQKKSEINNDFDYNLMGAYIEGTVTFSEKVEIENKLKTDEEFAELMYKVAPELRPQQTVIKMPVVRTWIPKLLKVAATIIVMVSVGYVLNQETSITDNSGKIIYPKPNVRGDSDTNSLSTNSFKKTFNAKKMEKFRN